MQNGWPLIVHKKCADHVETFEKNIQIELFHAKLNYRENITAKLYKFMPLQVTMMVKQRRSSMKNLTKLLIKKSNRHHIPQKCQNWSEKYECEGPFAICNRNERCKRLLNFAEKNLVITNSFFQNAANRHLTWEAPGAMTKNQVIS